MKNPKEMCFVFGGTLAYKLNWWQIGCWLFDFLDIWKDVSFVRKLTKWQPMCFFCKEANQMTTNEWCEESKGAFTFNSMVYNAAASGEESYISLNPKAKGCCEFFFLKEGFD